MPISSGAFSAHVFRLCFVFEERWRKERGDEIAIFPIRFPAPVNRRFLARFKTVSPSFAPPPTPPREQARSKQHPVGMKEHNQKQTPQNRDSQSGDARGHGVARRQARRGVLVPLLAGDERLVHGGAGDGDVLRRGHEHGRDRRGRRRRRGGGRSVAHRDGKKNGERASERESESEFFFFLLLFRSPITFLIFYQRLFFKALARSLFFKVCAPAICLERLSMPHRIGTQKLAKGEL